MLNLLDVSLTIFCELTTIICQIISANLTEDFCGVEPITHPPDVIETRPPPIVDEEQLRKAYNQIDSAVLGSKFMSSLVHLLIL